MLNDDLKKALKEQFHASLAMLQECVELTPEDLWLDGVLPRTTWRIALHATFFAHLGLSGSLKNYTSWPDRPENLYPEMWDNPESLEPFELAFSEPAISRTEVIRYIQFLSEGTESFIDAFDFGVQESGVPGYSHLTSLSALLMEIRHLQGHVGQLSERLFENGIESTWIGNGTMSQWKAWEEGNP